VILSRSNNVENKILVSQVRDIATSDALKEFIKKSRVPPPLSGVQVHPLIRYIKLWCKNIKKIFSN
jgi:hypothetical protein